MLGKMYSASVASQAQTAALTLMYVESAAGSVVLIERMWIKQTSFDTSENLGVIVRRGTAAGTDTDITPEPLEPGDTFGGVVGTNATVEPTYGADDQIIEDGFNVLSGYLWTPASDDEAILVTPASDVGMFLSIAPSASMDFSYGMTLREIG